MNSLWQILRADGERIDDEVFWLGFNFILVRITEVDQKKETSCAAKHIMN